MNNIDINAGIDRAKANINFDILGFLHMFVASIERDIDWAYPFDDFDEERAHVALQKVQGRINTLKDMLNKIEKV